MKQGYLASRYSRREELCGYKDQLEERGYSIPARWLLGEHQVHGLEASKAIEDDGPIPADLAVLFASDDVEDIRASDFLIAFTEPPRTGATRGGRHVELGLALERRNLAQVVNASFNAGWVVPKVFIVGPLENVFCALDEIEGRFSTFDKFIDALDKEYISL